MTEEYIPITETEGGAAPQEGKPHRKVLKIIIVVLLEIALLCAGLFFGYVYAKATIPQGQVLAEYMTIEELVEYYTPSSANMKKSVADFSAAGDYYGMYERVYYKLLTQTDVNVIAEGTTDSLNTVKVSIESEKKLENGFMHWSMRSTGDRMADKTTFTVDGYYNIADKFVKVKRFDNKGQGESKNGKEQSELAYVSKYGLLPFGFSNYFVTSETLVSGEYKTEEGLHVLALTLDPEGATEGYVVQMSGMSGQNATFEGGSILYTLYFDDSFTLRKTSVTEKYFIDYGFSIPCEAAMNERYLYTGEEGYSGLSEEEKYENVMPD